MRYTKFPSVLILLVIFTPSLLYAQEVEIPATTDQERTESIEQRKQMRANSIFREYPVQNIGPVVMSGRVTDIAVHKDLSRKFYIAFASGGVFKTDNSGNTMEPIFDHQGALTIGDIAISGADEKILWVGTGENNSSRSSYAGTGVYKSTDSGNSWSYVGLRGSQHIGRIITHPTDPEIAWVASQGPLYSMNDVRGVYKTTDGGNTWNRTLTPPDSTGVIDLVIHPENPDKLWATTWQRFRQAWNFREGGKGSAIYISNDGGETWQKSMQGFPEGDFVGRIGMDVSQSNPDILYAFLDNQYETKTKKEVEEDELIPADFLEMTKKELLKIPDKKLEQYLRSHNYPSEYTAVKIKQDVQQEKYEPKAIAEYLGDANEALFDTDIEGAEVYRSDDGGKTWGKVNSYPLDNLIYTYGYYFGEVRISPSDPEELYILGVPLLKSSDGGKTWKAIAENQPVHVDHHAMWIDPNDPQHLLLGNDGGLYESHDGGINFIHHNVAPVAQFYSINVDMEEPYNVYGGMQDNGVFTGSSQWAPNDGNEWERLLGGDGMHVAIDPRNSDIVYTGFQFGNYFRIDRNNDNYTRITPQHQMGEAKYRFNWNTPVEISNHNPDILYIGSQYVSRSFDRGETWTRISPDLTKNLPGGDVPYSTITTISESPRDFNTIWVGTDDGNVQVTTDGGNNWQLVSETLPKRRWVSEVQASPHDQATAYVSLNGYRFDEFKTYIYKTTDYGKTWESIKGNLPDDVANIIVQDPKHPDLLYAGLDHGTFVSFDDGRQWHLLNGVPNAAAYDMVVHPRDFDLVIGTHGRSAYIADLIPIYSIKDNRDKTIIAIETESVRHSDNWGEQPVQYREVIEPEVEWLYWIGDANVKDREVTITIKNEQGEILKELSDSGSYGFNRLTWNLRIKDTENDQPAEYLKPGKYTISYEINESSDETTFEVTSRNNRGDTDQRVFSGQEGIEYEEY